MTGSLQLFGSDVTAIVVSGGLALGVLGFLLAVYAVCTDESARESITRRVRFAILVLLLFGAGKAYGSVYVPDTSHCSTGAWHQAVSEYGWFSALILYYASGC